MLTTAEVTTIKAKATSVFIIEAKLEYAREQIGLPANGKHALEAMLYHHAMSMYEPGSSINYLSDCQVQAIYSRLRELRNV